MVDGRRRLASLPGVHRGGFESRAVELVFAVGWAAFWLLLARLGTLGDHGVSTDPGDLLRLQRSG